MIKNCSGGVWPHWRIILSAVLTILINQFAGRAFGQVGVTTLSPTNLNSIAGSATAQATVYPNGSAATVFFQYGTNTAYGATSSAVSVSGGAGGVLVSAAIFPNLPNTTFHVRAVATNSLGTTFGNDVSFLMPVIPPLVSGAVAVASATNAVVSVQIDPRNASAQVYARYGTVGSAAGYGFVTAVTNVTGIGARTVTLTLTNLQPNSTYFFGVTAYNSAGTNGQDDLSFTTGPLAPSVSSPVATSIGGQNFAVSALINPNSALTTVHFECVQTGGTTVLTSATNVVTAGNGAVTLSARFDQLLLNTCYYCSVVAVNAGGTSAATQTVCTVPLAPSVSTAPAANISSTSAYLAGNVLPNGSTANVSFNYGTTPAMGNTLAAGSVGNTTSPFPFSQYLGGLLPNTFYYYRAMASNAVGQSTGAVQVFTTGQSPPKPVVTSPSNSVTLAATQTRQAVAVGFVVSGTLSVFLKDGGAGYTSPPNVTVQITSGGGTNGTVTAAIISGAVSSLTVQNPGNYNPSGSVNVIVDPPPNPIQMALTNSTSSIIQLPAGTFDANTIITRNVTIRGQGSAITTVTGGNRDCVFKVQPGVTVTFEDLTISQGSAVYGGGIYNNGGSVIINRCRITGNHATTFAGEGGGIFNAGNANCTINDSEIDNNTSSHNGAGISNSGLNTAILPWLIDGVNDTSEAFGELKSLVSDPSQFGLKVVNTAKGVVYSVPDLLTAVASRISNPTQIGDDFANAVQSLTSSSIGSGLAHLTHENVSANVNSNFDQPYGSSWGTVGAASLFVNRTHIHDNTTSSLAATFGGGIENIVGLVVLTDCEINNNQNSCNLGAFGGAISSILGAARLSDCNVHDNVASSKTVVCDGGAIFTVASLLDAENTDFINNRAVAIYLSRGGAIHNDAGGSVTLNLCTLNGNTSGGGGAIENDYLTTLSCTNCTISGNSVSGIIGANGGGIGNDYGGTATLVNCTIDHNVAKGFARGGGIYNHCNYQSVSPFDTNNNLQAITIVQRTTATLINCTLSSNSVVGTDFNIPSLQGLAECAYENLLMPGSCSISDVPTAYTLHLPAQGGAAYNGSEADSSVAVGILAKPAYGELDLFSCTVVGNSATGGTLYNGEPYLVTDGGGIYTTDSSGLEAARWGYSINTYDNTLFANNQLNGLPDDFFAKAVYVGTSPVLMVINNTGPNLDSDGSLALAKKIGTGTIYTQPNPPLGPLADNGGPTETHALLTGNTALGTGSSDAPPTDERGVSRPQTGGDIGAFEAVAPRPAPDSYVTMEDQPLQVSATAGVLSNDFGAGMIAGLSAQASHGTVTLATNGGFVYTPALHYIGSDSFFYTNLDSAGLFAGPTKVSIQVNPVLHLLSNSPAMGSVNGSQSQVSLTFDTPVNSSLLSTGVLVRGSESVVQPFAVSTSNNVVQINTAAGFHPGELVTVELLRSLVATNGAVLGGSKTFQYVTQVPAGSGQFPTYSNLSSNYTTTIVLADFDGNGTIDAYVGGDLWDQIWLNDGHGNFTLVQSLPGNTTGAAAADLNGDGYLDLVVTKAGGVTTLPPPGTVNPQLPSDYNRVYFNDGTGHFTDSGQRLVPDTFVDPDSAPNPDNFKPVNSTFYIFVGNGWQEYDSTYTPNISDFYIYLNDGSSGVAIGDLNGDGYPDLFIINNTSKTSLGHLVSTPGNTVWLNNGHGSFTKVGPKLGNANAHGIVLADVDGNGTLDAVVAADDGTEIWLNDGNANFTNSSTLQTGDFLAEAVAVGDINGNGSMDIITSHVRPYYDTNLPTFGNQVYTNDGAGHFTPTQFFGNIFSYGLALGDLNADGRLDVFCTGLLGCEAWLNTGTNFVKAGPTFGMQHFGRAVALADLDGDGDLDAFVGNFGYTQDSCQVWFNDAAPTANNFNFSAAEDSFLSVPPFGVLSGTSDSDSPTLILQTNTVKVYTAPTLGALIGLTYNLPNWNANNFSFDSQGNNIYLQTVPVYANHGSLNLRSDGSFTYTPQSLYHGTDSFPYVVSDGFLSTTGTVSITVTPVNHPPTAVNDYYPLTANPLVISSANGVLANDSDPDGDSMTASLAQPPDHGVVTLQPDGSFTYTEAAGYTGPDSFLYSVSDGKTNSIARVKLGNTPPVARDDLNYLMPGNGLLTVSSLNGVLANDTDADGDPISATLAIRPAHGTVTLNSDGSFSYVRATNYTGPDSFTYRASDGIAVSAPARVKIGNTPPVANTDGPYTAFLNQPLTISASQGVLANDQDADGDKLTARLVSGPVNGTVTVNPDGSFTYTPTQGFSGNDSFTYVANDGLADSPPATVNLGVYGLLHVIAVNPSANSVGLNSNSIQIRFDGNLDPAGVAGKFLVHGSLSGVHAWTAAVATNEATLSIPQPFVPGEKVSVTAIPGLKGQGYLQLASGYTYEFILGAPRGSGNFTNELVGTANAYHSAVVAGDLNGDGLPDVITVNGAVVGDSARVYWNQGNGNFLEQPIGSLGDNGRYRQIVLGDFDGNGSLDAFAVGSQTEFWRNDGAGNMTITQLPASPYYVQWLAVGDFNRDGALDVFACGTDFSVVLTDANGNSYYPTVIWVWFNDGQGHFTMGPQTRISASLMTGAVSDVNGDGAPDLWLTGITGDQIWTNNGTGQFAWDTQPLGNEWGLTVAMGDLNGDGAPDAVVYYALDRARVWLNNGQGKFTPEPQPLLLTNNVIDLALGDIQGNGRLDLAVACRLSSSSSSNGISLVLTNDGTGHFGEGAIAPSSSDFAAVALADFDTNGTLDAFFAVGLLNPGTNQIWLNHRLPLANDDYYPSTTTSIAAPGVLANDLPGDGPQFNAVLDSQPSKGTATLGSNGSFTYAPGGGFAGSDVFTYHVNDGLQNSRIARVKIGNTTPIANADSYVALNDLPLNVTPALGVLANDTDAETDPLLAVLNQGPAHGTLQLNPDGSFIYNATAGYTGSDTFTYRATDRYATSAVATVTLTVHARLSVTQKTPGAYALTAPATTAITVQFNHALDPASVLGQVAVSGSLSGLHACVVSAVSNVLSITPAVPFRPTELVSVTLSSALRGLLGEQMASPVIWQFTVAAPFGVGQLTDSGQQLIAINATNAAQVALADVDGDGALDAIVTQGGEFNSNRTAFLPGSLATMVWHNDGHGVFTDSGQRLGTNFTTAALQVLALDANGDGAPDFVVMRNLTTGELWTNNGTGTFSLSSQSFLLSDQTVTNNTGVVAGDFNGDGLPDLAILHAMTPFPSQTTAIAIWTNNGHGAFVDSGQRLENAGDKNPMTLLAGDIFGHGVLDILEVNFGSASRIWENDGTGHFTDTGITFGSGFYPGVAALGDLNGDGTPDFVGASSTNITVWLNDGQGHFSSTGQFLNNANGNPAAASIADMDGDGHLDIVLLDWKNQFAFGTNLNTSTIYYNDGTANFTTRGTVIGIPTIQPRNLAVGDLNGDGAPDVFLVNLQQPRSVWFNTAGLGPIANANAIGSIFIGDNSTIAPFTGVTLQALPGANVTVTVEIDDLSKGAFTPASLTASGFTGPAGTTYSHAATTVAAAQAALQRLVFAPVPNLEPVGQSDTTSFTIVVSDGTTFRTNALTQVTAVSVNDPPIANNDSGAGFTTTEAAAFTTANVLANDTDVDPGDSTNLVVASFSTEGTVGLVTNLGNGTFRYDPNGAFTWLPQGVTTNDTFSYVVTDNHGGYSTGQVSITITGLNNSPVANDDSLTLSEHTGSTNITAQLLVNDSDPDAGETATLVISAVNTTGTHGSVVFLSGKVSYNPNNAFGNLPLGSNVVDHFTYTIQDVHGAAATANVSVTIVGQNDPPIAGNVALSMLANSPATNLTTLLLASDSDPDPGETASLSVLSINPAAARGILTFSNGAVLYQPGPQFQSLPQGSNLVDTFNYTIQDVHGATAQAAVTVTNTGVNDPPVAGPDQVTAFQGQATNLTSLMLSNDFDPDTGETPLLFISAVFTNSTTGTLLLTNGNVIYTPSSSSLLASSQTASDAFTYQISDPHGLMATGAVAVTVLPVNHPPVAGQSSIVISALAGPTDVTAALLANASDPDPGDTATLAITSVFTNSTVGIVTLSNGIVLYNPNGQFGFLKPSQTSGDTFLYSVSDQFGASSIGSASVIITPPIMSQVTLANGQIHLHILGVPNATCTVFVSTDLVNWSVAGTAVQTSPGTFDFYDSVVSGQPGRFYRVEFSNIPMTVTTPVPPRILGGVMTNTQFLVNFSASPGNYNVLGSTNLIQWQILGPAAQVGPILYQFTDTNAPAFPRRFYRISSQ